MFRSKMRSETVPRAIALGDEIFDPLAQATNNFSAIDAGGALPLTEVMASVRTKRFDQALESMLRSPRLLPRLIAAAVFAKRGEPIEPMRPLLLRVATADLATSEQPLLRDGPDEGISNNEVWIYQELAISALGRLRDPSEIKTVAAVLGEQEASPVHGRVCEALAQAGGKDSIAALTAAMANPEFENTPAAFKALVAVGSPDAIRLAIARIDPKVESYSGGWLVPELQRTTGQRFGADREEWEEWWRSKQ